jgi:hypothetical protein
VGTTLSYLATDPAQHMRFREADIEGRFPAGSARYLRAHDAPVELYGRYGIGNITVTASATREEAL